MDNLRKRLIDYLQEPRHAYEIEQFLGDKGVLSAKGEELTQTMALLTEIIDKEQYKRELEIRVVTVPKWHLKAEFQRETGQT